MIINLGCASVDNHIPRDDIFDYRPRRECNIYIIYVGSDHFFWVKVLNFNIFSGFQKNKYFLGVKILWIFFGGITINLTIFRGHFYAF